MGSRARLAATAIVALILIAPSSAFAAADLSVSVTPEPTSLPLGGPGTTAITIAVANAGPDSAAEVTGGATIGAPQLKFIGFVSISQGVGIFSEGSSPPITFNFGAIPAGGTATLKYTLDDAQSGLGTMNANATTTTPESSTANNTSTASVEVTALVPSVTTLPFGSQAIGGIGPAQTLIVTNRAGIPVQVSNALLSGGDFVTSADGCSGTKLAVDASCQVSMRFAPSALGNRTGSITVASPTANVSPIAIALTGTGTAVPVDAKPASLALAGVPKSIKSSAFRKGFSVKVTPSEPVALDLSLLGTARKGALASAFDLQLFSRSLPRAAGTRTIKVKPAAKLLGRIRRKVKVRLRVIATDAAGNQSSAQRSITVKPDR